MLTEQARLFVDMLAKVLDLAAAASRERCGYTGISSERQPVRADSSLNAAQRERCRNSRLALTSGRC